MSGSATSELVGPWGRRLLLAYVAAIGIPLFVLPNHRTTNIPQILSPMAPILEDDQPLRLHWIVGWAALVGAYLLFRCLSERRVFAPPRLGWILGLAVVFLVSLGAGMMVSPAALNVVYFVQTTLPLVGFFAGAALAESTAGIRRLSWTLIAATAFSVTVILLLHPLARAQPEIYGTGALADLIASNRVARAIPQVRDYFPFIVATSLSLAVATFRTTTRMSLRVCLVAAVSLFLAFFSLSWSRMALVMFGVVVVWPLLFWRPSMRANRALVWAAGAVVFLAAAALLMTQAGTIGARLSQIDVLDSDNRRIQFTVEGMTMIAEDPVLGRRFIANWNYDPAQERELRIPRMYKAHNQYLDYGIRAGLPAMFILAAIMWLVARDLRTALNRPDSGPGSRALLIGVSGALIAVAIGNMASLFLVQAQTGSLAWLLVGVAARSGAATEPALSGDAAPTGGP